MSKNNVKTTIRCKNIAPLENLNEEILSGSLKIGIFANNGSGKTFISRLFKLLEDQIVPELNADGTSPTDKLLSFGKSNGSFSFQITDQTDIKEQITIDFSRKNLPKIPTTCYLYHTFNQDYVEDNIRALDFEKESDIKGFILGKTNIDLKEDENKLEKLETDCKILKTQIEKEINQYIEKNINHIQNIKRLDEYRYLLNTQNFFDGVNKDNQSVSKTFEELLTN
ncbi:MAG: hypothetical protein LBC20_06360, partial [Planctomycetaceae bacterium]|nr:hypothetical protein [Planctomycetaceae bacterium]